MNSVARFKRVYVEITSSCNLHCSFCQETLRKPHFMSVDEFRTVIERIGHYTNYIYLHVKGEPLLHPQLGEILKICQDADMTVNLTTNATLIKEKLPVLLSILYIRLMCRFTALTITTALTWILIFIIFLNPAKHFLIRLKQRFH